MDIKEIETSVINLTNELRQKFELYEKDRLTKAEFLETQKKIEDRISELERRLVELYRPPIKTEQRSPESKAFLNWLRKGILSPEEAKALVVAQDEYGGYLAPREFVEEIIKAVTEYSPVRNYARIIQTNQRAIQIPKRTGTLTASWVAETSERTETTGTQFALETIDTHELYALVKISKQLLEDALFNMEAEIISEISEKFGVAEGAAFISGNGSGKPAGILVNANVSYTPSGNASAITADSLINLVYAIKTPYRENGVFLMNRNTIAAIRLLKDQTNNYLWQPDYSAKGPGTLLGYPIVECPDMPNIASNAFPVVFGDLKRGYLIVDRIQIEMQRLVERYAEFGLVAFLARKRVGGQVVLAEALQKLKIATT